MTIQLRVRVKSRGAIDTLTRYPKEADAAMERWAGKGAQFVRGLMVRTIRTRQRPGGTGVLSGGVQVEVVGRRFKVYPTANYAGFVEDDTRPHAIHPRRPGGVLAFPGSGGRLGIRGGRPVTVFRFGGRTTTGSLVYARSVWHPGTKGMHYARDTADASVGPLTGMLEAELEEARRRAEGSR